MRVSMLLLLLLGPAAWADELAALCADRTAIEHVYYNHRIGTKPPFEEVFPPALAEKLVKQELHKKAVLKDRYAVDVTPAMIEAEVRRIEASTRAPEMLTELKAALGNNPGRFARTVACPIVVDRLLRERFSNDDSLHAALRGEMEGTRGQLLTAINATTTDELCALLRRAHSNSVQELVWRLDARPEAHPAASTAEEIEIKTQFGPAAQLLNPPTADAGAENYFSDLPDALQRVLRVQLRRPGDVSAVIEMPDGFLLYVCRERTDVTLGVACLSLPKRSFEEWLNEAAQTHEMKHLITNPDPEERNPNS